MKKILMLVLFIGVTVIFSGCAKDNNATTDKNSEKSDSVGAGAGWINNCKQEKVNLPNYGDPGKRLKNCFVEYPGEPTRQDKSYYIVEDICGQFTKEFVENMLGQKIVKTEPPKIVSLNNCSYYLNEKDYLLFNLEYLKIENQKIFYEQAGEKTEKNPKIPADNLVVYKGTSIDGIYFVLSPQKFISIRPNSKNVIDDEKLLNLAANIGEAIKNYK